jgi:hypothetical protein
MRPSFQIESARNLPLPANVFHLSFAKTSDEANPAEGAKGRVHARLVAIEQCH